MSKPYRAKWDERAGVSANAARELPRLAADYFSQVREVLAADPPPAELHAVRLASKRFRYTLELFRSSYGPGFETRLERLKHVQQFLGDVNDCVAAGKLLAKSARGRRFVEERSQAKVREFREYWTKEFDAPGQEHAWTAFLTRTLKTS